MTTAEMDKSVNRWCLKVFSQTGAGLAMHHVLVTGDRYRASHRLHSVTSTAPPSASHRNSHWIGRSTVRRSTRIQHLHSEPFYVKTHPLESRWVSFLSPRCAPTRRGPGSQRTDLRWIVGRDARYSLFSAAMFSMLITLHSSPDCMLCVPSINKRLNQKSMMGIRSINSEKGVRKNLRSV